MEMYHLSTLNTIKMKTSDYTLNDKNVTLPPESRNIFREFFFFFFTMREFSKEGTGKYR